MNQTTFNAQVEQSIGSIIPNVLETMLGFKAAPCAPSPLPERGVRVTGSIGLAGEEIVGAIYLHLAEPFAQVAARAMLGLGADEACAESDVNDVVGELCNMIAGGFKSELCDAGLACAISAPAIIRGSHFTIQPSLELQTWQLSYSCQEHRLTVELHLQRQ
jgi:chemotaxis protein CheX